MVENQAARALMLFSAFDYRHSVEPFRALIFSRCVSDSSFCSNPSLVIGRGTSSESRSFLSNPSEGFRAARCLRNAIGPRSILERAIENDDRIILVAAGGGGIQASAWTARVLTGLEEICAEKRPGRFSQSVKLLSGVSGGSVGIMYFVTACKLEGFLTRKRSWNGGTGS